MLFFLLMHICAFLEANLGMPILKDPNFFPKECFNHFVSLEDYQKQEINVKRQNDMC